MSSTTHEGSVSEISQFPGECLLAARESKGLSQKQVAEALRLPTRYIMWIEEGAFEKLPSLVFAKGYVRSYAKAVSLESEPLVSMFDQIYGVERKEAPIQSVSKVDPQVKLSDPVMRWSGWLFLILLLAAVIWWWQTQFGLTALPTVDELTHETVGEMPLVDGNKLQLPTLTEAVTIKETAENTTEAPKITAVEDEPKYLSDEEIKALQSSLDGNIPAKPVTLVSADVDMHTTEKMTEEQDSEPHSVTNASQSATDTSIETPVSQVAQTAQTGLSMVFSGESWITLKDATGRTLVNKAKKAGETLAISGAAPLSLIIGRASSVKEIVYNGAEVELAPHIKGNVAKIKLPKN